VLSASTTSAESSHPSQHHTHLTEKQRPASAIHLVPSRPITARSQAIRTAQQKPRPWSSMQLRPTSAAATQPLRHAMQHESDVGTVLQSDEAEDQESSPVDADEMKQQPPSSHAQTTQKALAAATWNEIDIEEGYGQQLPSHTSGSAHGVYGFGRTPSPYDHSYGSSTGSISNTPRAAAAAAAAVNPALAHNVEQAEQALAQTEQEIRQLLHHTQHMLQQANQLPSPKQQLHVLLPLEDDIQRLGQSVRSVRQSLDIARPLSPRRRIDTTRQPPVFAKSMSLSSSLRRASSTSRQQGPISPTRGGNARNMIPLPIQNVPIGL
jgi:uncharacterized protein YoxC